MKILYYNWIQFDNKKNIGGGVNVYQRNLIEYLINSTDNEVFFISSGWKYNPFRKNAYIKETKNIFGDRCRTFEIINSPVMSPAFSVYMNPEFFTDDLRSVEIFDSFIKKYGPFDVIHFNNIEGISSNVLSLKAKYQNTKFIVSIHNYQPICPLVQYFQNHNNTICRNYRKGEECLRCAVSLPSNKEYYRRCKKYAYKVLDKKSLGMLKPIGKILSFIAGFHRSLCVGSVQTMIPREYVRYREHNVEMLNRYADSILAVSDRVRTIMVQNGISSGKIFVSYIGTKLADSELGHSVAVSAHPFTIAYLGYERIDKGYFFLLDSLEKMDKKIASQINVVLAVANIHKELATDKLKNFNHVTIFNGYTHKQLRNILADVNLGMVPVLWEDNLPQVAIEMVACGVPILCSDFGGASELCKSELFKFKGADEKSFTEKLVNFVSKPELLEEYWKYHSGLTTMQAHVEELNKYYS